MAEPANLFDERDQNELLSAGEQVTPLCNSVTLHAEAKRSDWGQEFVCHDSLGKLCDSRLSGADCRVVSRDRKAVLSFVTFLS